MAPFALTLSLAGGIFGAASFIHAGALPLEGAQAPIGLGLGFTQLDAAGHKPLVNSTGIQSLITPEALMKRAEDLYAVANLSAEDWGHPTRVIGSKGVSLLIVT